MGFRDAIRERLLTVCSNVYQPSVPDKSTVKPYIVIRMGVETQDGMKYGYKQIVMVYPYVERGDYNNLSSLVNSIVDSFSTPITYNGSDFSLMFEGKVGQEYRDPDWDALTQPLEFSYNKIHERQ